MAFRHFGSCKKMTRNLANSTTEMSTLLNVLTAMPEPECLLEALHGQWKYSHSKPQSCWVVKFQHFK